MLSKAHLHMTKILKRISRSFGIQLLTEVKEGNKKYDFYFPSNPPIVVEVDGMNHHQSKADGFFFKSDKQLMNYKANDRERDRLHRMGRIKLYRFTDQEFPSLSEVLDIFGDETIEILKKGIDEENAYAKAIIRNREYNRRRKKQYREFREKSKS